MKLLDLISPEKSDFSFKRFRFPDGQPHFELTDLRQIRSTERDEPIEVLCRITSADDILDLALAIDALASTRGVEDRGLYLFVNVAYMLGARMDRRIAPGQPWTLGLLAAMLNKARGSAAGVRVLDPHSEKTEELLNLLPVGVIRPDRLVRLALDHFDPGAAIVIPDAGAIPRTSGIIERLGLKNPVARFEKKRDSQTGKLSDFALMEGDVSGRRCLIVDDLCDGGGTFSGIAKILENAGAGDVALCVTHGIFSKGLVIPGIDRTYCTDSFPFFERDDVKFRFDFTESGGFAGYARTGWKHASVYVLADFLRDEVRALHAGGAA